MKYQIVSCLSALGVLIAGAAQAQKINLPPVTRVTLDNGARVILMENHRAPTFTLEAVFPGGDVSDPAGKEGVSDLTADLLRKGTEKRTATQIAEEIEYLGGSLETVSGSERLVASLNTLAKDADTGLDLLTDVLRHPTFPQEELERERQLAIARLQTLGENPGAVASRVAEELVFHGHPYGRQSTITAFKAITREDVLACYRRLVLPNHLILVAVGDFNASAMLAQLKARFGDWPKGDADTFVVPPVTPGPRRIVLIDKPDATQTQVRWVRVGLPRNTPEKYALDLADTILGGGFTSRLINEIRVNRSLTYGIGSAFRQEKAGGTFGVSTFTKIETTRAILDATDAVLKQASAGGLTAPELHKAKGYLAGQFAIGLQTPEALAAQLADIAFYGLPNDYLATYLPKIEAVSLTDINRIAQTYFPPEQLSLALVAPYAKVKSQLSGLDPIETRSIETIGK